MEKILEEIREERKKQDEKWGEQNHPCLVGGNTELISLYYGIPSEEKAKQQCDSRFINGVGTYADIAIEEMSEIVHTLDINKRREEIVQLAAVCVAWIQKIDRDLKPIH